MPKDLLARIVEYYLLKVNFFKIITSYDRVYLQQLPCFSLSLLAFTFLLLAKIFLKYLFENSKRERKGGVKNGKKLRNNRALH